MTLVFDPLASQKDGTAFQLKLQFEDNARSAILFGQHDENLVRIEGLLGVSIISRGNHLTLSGGRDAVEHAKKTLESLYLKLTSDTVLSVSQIEAAVRFAEKGQGSAKPGVLTIRTRKRSVEARSPGQIDYIKALMSKDLVFGLGPAGTGKTYLAVAYGASLLADGKVERIILSRPAVEAGERLGFLPGDLKEKVDPYLRPLYDALYDMLPGEQVAKKLEAGDIEVAPLAFMRGRTLKNAFVILDEAQNTTAVQMKMFLTRLGENSRMVVTGDLTQVDLPRGVRSGMGEALDVLKKVDKIGVVRLGSKDVVRHDLVARIVEAYDDFSRDRIKNDAPPEQTSLNQDKDQSQ